MSDQPATQPVGWRDVHALVKESRDDILASVKEGFAGTNDILAGHGQRISALETAELLRREVAIELARVDAGRATRRDRFFEGTRGVVVMCLAAAGFLITTAKTFGLLG